eukprot:2265050-Alexandrium_andersonii.AAC.1
MDHPGHAHIRGAGGLRASRFTRRTDALHVFLETKCRRWAARQRGRVQRREGGGRGIRCRALVALTTVSVLSNGREPRSGT